MNRGIFVTLEGGEGAGKSTHTKLLAEYFENQGYDVLPTREPGGVKTSEEIRRLILSKDLAKTPLTELLLFEAARSQYVADLVRPALEAGKIVISDRFYDSTTVYQGYAGGLPLGLIERMNAIATDNIVPDLTFIIDVPPEIGLERTKKVSGPDFMDAKGREFHTKVYEGFKQLITPTSAYPAGRMVPVEYVSNNLDAMQERMRSTIIDYLSKRFSIKLR